MAFRVSSGMQTNSIESACRAIDFVVKYELSPDLLRSAGDYFDPHKLRMAKTPSKWVIARRAFGLGTMTLFVMLALAVSTEDRILVSLKKTGTWLWLSTEDATIATPKLRGSRETLTFAECPKPSVSNWTTEDIKIVCSIRSDPALRIYIERTRRMQKSVFLTLSLLLAMVGVTQWIAYFKAIAAADLAKELETKNLAATARPRDTQALFENPSGTPPHH